MLRGASLSVPAGTTTVLLATHDLDVAARIADRVAFLAHGCIEREGPAS